MHAPLGSLADVLFGHSSKFFRQGVRSPARLWGRLQNDSVAIVHLFINYTRAIMRNSHHPKRIAIFWDLENVPLCARRVTVSKSDIEAWLGRRFPNADVVLKNVYGDLDRSRRFIQPLLETGFKLIDIPHSGKAERNAVDKAIIRDMSLLAIEQPDIDIFVLVSGDADYSHTVLELKEKGKHVIVIARKGATAGKLRSICSGFISYAKLTQTSKGVVACQRGPVGPTIPK